MKIKQRHTRESIYISARKLFHRFSLPRWMVLLMDSGVVVTAFLVSYVLRFNFETAQIDYILVFRQSMLALVVYLGFELIFKSFAGLIRHTTIRDIFNVVLTTCSALLFLLGLTMVSRISGWNRIFNIPISIILIHFVSVTASMFLLRVLIKMFYEMVTTNPASRKNVIIFGAGTMGVIMKRVILEDRSNEYNIIAFLDNNRNLQNKILGGIPVYSPDRLKRPFLEKYSINTMIFAIRDISMSEKSEIFEFAVELGLEVMEVPPVNTWLNGRFNLKQLHKIRVEDLLRRDPIQLNMELIEGGLMNKTIMVTGAAGSIGSEIVRQLTQFRVRKLILLDNAETPMFNLERELNKRYRKVPAHTVLVDVTNLDRVEPVFKEHRPDIVFHAAAYKHVSLMEENPHEAIRVNVGGTMILTKLAIKYGVSKFVMVSTDKAVNPCNVMGASKRMAEMTVRSNSIFMESRTQFVITRFGNVLGSNGSVIPIFRQQIEEGGPVTVTHPDITRYFMTIPEACQLVLEAGFMGEGGEVFVFDMGKPVKIVNLARQMIKLSGLEPGKDIRIVYTGLRPGEKLYEELLSNREKLLPTYNPKVRVATPGVFKYKTALKAIQRFLYTYTDYSEEELIRKMEEIVPEYQSNNEKFGNGNGQPSVELGLYPD